MAGERGTSNSGGVGPSIGGPLKVGGTPPKDPPTPPIVPAPGPTPSPSAGPKAIPDAQEARDNPNTAEGIAQRKKDIAAKKLRQKKWREAHARQLATAAAAEADEHNLEYIRGLEIFTADPFTKKLGKFLGK